MIQRDKCFNPPYSDDKSGVKKDPYVDDNGILITKLTQKFETKEALRSEEKRIIEPLITSNTLFEELTCDSYIELLQRVHNKYFRNIFLWAGQFRCCDIEKEEKFFCPGVSLTYGHYEEIYPMLFKIMKNLNNTDWLNLHINKRVNLFADYLAEIWLIHPFRDGNTRALIGFAKVFSMIKGFDFNIKPLVNILSRPVSKDGREGLSIRDCFVGATLPEYPEPDYLYKVFKKAMT